MKTVFTNKQVTHVWASQTQSEGRNGSGSIFFHDERIYSYGRHFEMARFITPDVVFITDRKYSITTAKHLGLVHRAVSHKNVFVVPSFEDHTENITYLVNQARQYFDKAKRARTNVSWLLEQGESAVRNVRRYLGTFPQAERLITGEIADFWFHLDMGHYLDSETQARILAKERQAAEEVRREEAEANARRIAEEATDLEAWKQGASIHRYFAATALRINGDTVETTHGAQVPTIEARKLYRALTLGVNLEGRRVGHFTVNSVDADVIKIGCHTIPISEIHRIGSILLSEPETVAVEKSNHPLDAWMN